MVTPFGDVWVRPYISFFVHAIFDKISDSAAEYFCISSIALFR